MPKGHMQESCSFHSGQEAGSKIGRAQVQEITSKGPQFPATFNSACFPNSPLSYELINGSIHQLGNRLWTQEFEGYFHPNCDHCLSGHNTGTEGTRWPLYWRSSGLWSEQKVQRNTEQQKDLPPH